MPEKEKEIVQKEATAKTEDTTQKVVKLAKAGIQSIGIPGSAPNALSPWYPFYVDKMEFDDEGWVNVVKECRYYYTKDPLAAIVLNKTVDIAFNEVILRAEGKRKDTLDSIWDSIEPMMMQFLKSCGLEYLLSGLVVPEMTFTQVPKDKLIELGIQRFNSLVLPTDMWLRDPASVTIKSPLIGGKASYFVKVPENLRNFIKSEGKYTDSTGGSDFALYTSLLAAMPEFVKQVQDGEVMVLLDNPYIIRARTITGNPYPIPYLYPVLESLKHKRNLKRMDYSLASRVITAIMLVKMGSDTFPLTEDNEDQLDDLKKEMMWRETQSFQDVERIFQLFGNHTLSIEWVMPDVKALLDDVKYKAVNADIAYGMGFPKMLVSGEADRSFSSNPDIATISPIHTMEQIRMALLPMLRHIIDIIVSDNNINVTVDVDFKPINLMAVGKFTDGIAKLYDAGNLSREDYAAVFGFDVYEQFDKKVKENSAMKEMSLETFAPTPHSNAPTVPGKKDINNPNNQQTKQTKQTTQVTKVTKKTVPVLKGKPVKPVKKSKQGG